MFGFNAVLAAVGPGLIYRRPGLTSLAVAVIAATFMPMFQTICTLALTPSGLPTMSLPFITATWLVLLLLGRLTDLRPPS